MDPRRTVKPWSARLLIALLLVEGVLGLYGGGALVLAPSGRLLGMPTAWLDGSPFGDYLVPGLILALVLGALPLVVAYGLWAEPRSAWARALEHRTHEHWAWFGAGVVGAGMLIWIGVQVSMLRMGSPLQLFIGLLGATLIALALLPPVRRHYARS